MIIGQSFNFGLHIFLEKAAAFNYSGSRTDEVLFKAPLPFWERGLG